MGLQGQVHSNENYACRAALKAFTVGETDGSVYHWTCKSSCPSSRGEGRVCGKKSSGPKQKDTRQEQLHLWPETEMMSPQTCKYVTGSTAEKASFLEGQELSEK